MDPEHVMARTLVYTATWPRYRAWCEEHDVAPCGALVTWASTNRDLQGHYQSQIIFADPPPAEIVEGVRVRHLEVITELPKAEVRAGLFLERAERESYSLRVAQVFPGLWHARCVGTSRLDWPANPGRLGFTREQALARATKQARKRSNRMNRGEEIVVPVEQRRA